MSLPARLHPSSASLDKAWAQQKCRLGQSKGKGRVAMEVRPWALASQVQMGFGLETTPPSFTQSPAGRMRTKITSSRTATDNRSRTYRIKVGSKASGWGLYELSEARRSSGVGVSLCPGHYHITRSSHGTSTWVWHNARARTASPLTRSVSLSPFICQDGQAE